MIPGTKVFAVCPDCKTDLVFRCLQFFCEKCDRVIDGDKIGHRYVKPWTHKR